MRWSASRCLISRGRKLELTRFDVGVDVGSSHRHWAHRVDEGERGWRRATWPWISDRGSDLVIAEAVPAAGSFERSPIAADAVVGAELAVGLELDPRA